MTLLRCGAVLLLSLTLLTACESSEQKAARHLQSALELIEKGDGERALVEFRNVFQLDPDNRAARMAFAGLLRDRGNLAEALAQYQQVIDRAPQDSEALVQAAVLAADLSRWPDAGRFADMQLAITPNDPAMRAVRVAVDYAEALSGADSTARVKAAQTAATLLEGAPGTVLLHRVIVDNHVQNAEYSAAIAAIDKALTIFPEEKGLYLSKVTVFATIGDKSGVEAELKQAISRFPDDLSIAASLYRWYIAEGQIDKAEAFLRDKALTGDLTAGLDLVNFLRQYRSIDAALAEIGTLLAKAPAPAAAADGVAADGSANKVTPEVLRSLRASLMFEQGKRAEAIAEMQDILVAAPASEQILQIKVMLAQMQFNAGDAVQARALVEEVLTADPGQVAAIKLKAAWLIDDDKTDDAIALLRKALDANPRDAEGFTLLAGAYDRAGTRELAGDMLSQAVLASGKAPAESLRYANFLMADEKYLPAETLLVDALRLDPENLSILANLGRLYVLMKDWPRATGVVDRLDELATPEALQISQGLRPAVLAGSQRVEEAIDFLKSLSTEGDSGLSAQMTLIQAYLANGQPDKASLLATELLAKSPESPEIRFIMAAVQGATGDVPGAVAGYRALLAQDANRALVWTALVRQLVQDGKRPEAEAALDEALIALPDSGDLLLFKAGFLEQRQDIEGAIAIYKTLYARDTSNQILANNLASLLSSFRQDPESLEQAHTIARRLRGTKVPAFADTHGWITHLRGNAAEALPYLETAAQGLTEDPMVQFHLAEVYKALNRPEEARAQYDKVLALVPAEDARDFVQTARKAVAQN